MLIYNQDRDQTFNFVGEDHNFYTNVGWHKGVCTGIGLYVDGFRLGGFDKVQDVIDEITAIENCPGMSIAYQAMQTMTKKRIARLFTI